MEIRQCSSYSRDFKRNLNTLHDYDDKKKYKKRIQADCVFDGKDDDKPRKQK